MLCPHCSSTICHYYITCEETVEMCPNLQCSYIKLGSDAPGRSAQDVIGSYSALAGRGLGGSAPSVADDDFEQFLDTLMSEPAADSGVDADFSCSDRSVSGSGSPRRTPAPPPPPPPLLPPAVGRVASLPAGGGPGSEGCAGPRRPAGSYSLPDPFALRRAVSQRQQQQAEGLKLRAFNNATRPPAPDPDPPAEPASKKPKRCVTRGKQRKGGRKGPGNKRAEVEQTRRTAEHICRAAGVDQSPVGTSQQASSAATAVPPPAPVPSLAVPPPASVPNLAVPPPAPVPSLAVPPPEPVPPPTSVISLAVPPPAPVPSLAVPSALSVPSRAVRPAVSGSSRAAPVSFRPPDPHGTLSEDHEQHGCWDGWFGRLEEPYVPPRSLLGLERVVSQQFSPYTDPTRARLGDRPSAASSSSGQPVSDHSQYLNPGTPLVQQPSPTAAPPAQSRRPGQLDGVLNLDRVYVRERQVQRVKAWARKKSLKVAGPR